VDARAGTRRLGAEPFVDLVSFRADGSPAHTPVWVSGDGERLFVSTFGDSWKVRRIRANPVVAVAACDGPGALLPGAVSYTHLTLPTN
jgi:PPOX class probable F420-dependent enzyme